MIYKDYFSQHSCHYSRYRPRYPQALFTYLMSQTKQRERAWDCGTGNGQAALALANFFTEVIASDASQQQIANAVAHERVKYIVKPAEASGLAPASIDLVTVAQALHWFDLELFYTELRRVLRPGGIVAVWCYGLVQVSSAVDEVVEHFYRDTVGPYWPPERQFVERGYRNLLFSFTERNAPHFAMEAQWDLEYFVRYLGTWSAVQRYREQRLHDPLQLLQADLMLAWGEANTVRSIYWPIYLRIGCYE
jgi:ubiquinone/menaquinone biosynthesis C-methylase UbiE